MLTVTRTLAAFGLAIGIAACTAAPDSGIADPDVFRATAMTQVVTGVRPADAVAACFEERATLLPTSIVTDDPETGGRLYRLRAVGRTYEEILFIPNPNGGSTAQVLIAPNLKPSWQDGFTRDRGAMLEACASGAVK
jgi:hypothetical protein